MSLRIQYKIRSKNIIKITQNKENHLFIVQYNQRGYVAYVLHSHVFDTMTRIPA